MKKRVVVLALALMVACTAGLSAFGIGLQADGNAGASFTTGVSLTVKFDSVPFVLAANWYLGDNVQIAPSFSVNVVPSLSVGNVFFPISAGFRIWFR